MSADDILADIDSLKNLTKRHIDALRASEAADRKVLEELDGLERIFEKEASLMEKKIKARERVEGEQ